MSDYALRVENLSKLYHIGVRPVGHRTAREAIADTFAAPFRFLRNPRAATRDREADTIWALKDISFDVKPGEIVGIIGRNGAGKTTLLKILARITEPTEGRARVHGRVQALLQVGTGFHPDLTGRENIFLNGAILGMKRAEIVRKFDEIVSFAEVDRFIDTPVKHYSSGMYLRLAFAVAAHLEPEILFVDEVLAVGDLQFQNKCLGKMQSVSASGRTVLFVSHNLSAMVKLCSRAVLLDEGRQVADGPAPDVVATYVATALGATGTATWDQAERSPGQDGFKLLSVMLTDDDATPIHVVSCEQPLRVEIAYAVSRPNLRFRCKLSFQTRGVLAFNTVEPVEAVRDHPGRYTSTVTIPGNLLAEGDYTVTVNVFASRGTKLHMCRVDDAIAFQVWDPMTGGSARGDYAESFGGVLRPLLSWQLRYAGQE